MPQDDPPEPTGAEATRPVEPTRPGEPGEPDQGEPGEPDQGEPDQGEPDQGEPHWWEDARMPWQGKPGPRDIRLYVAFVLTGIYTLVMLPLRPKLIGSLPLLLVGLTGSRSGLVTVGALAALGRADWWWVGWIIGSISLIKFDPIFFFAGRFWGRGLVEVFAGRSKRAARNADRAERLARRFGILAILLSYVVPIPSAVIFATLGAAGMRFRTFVAVDLAAALAINGLWLYLGHRLGQPAVDVVNLIARYSSWISIALVAFIVISAVWGARRKAVRDQTRTGAAG